MVPSQMRPGKNVCTNNCLPKLSMLWGVFIASIAGKSKLLLRRRTTAVLSCQLPPLRAEGSKKKYFSFVLSTNSSVSVIDIALNLSLYDDSRNKEIQEHYQVWWARQGGLRTPSKTTNVNLD